MSVTSASYSHTLSPEKKTILETDGLASTEFDLLEDACIYVHCFFDIPEPGLLVRIWKTTTLNDCHSSATAQLLHAENISYAPAWTPVPHSGTYHFLLIFSALPKSCQMFDLIEDIPQPGGFISRHITRNDSDVYRIRLH
ncbi:MAG: hypothetical protein JST43_07205 [Bacteroidetes bacterium]|nr:hypothetical protein [Bacteroidota bacterium]MBS1541778.1 hypothetical protein [Bacteroidota bacterium]